MHGRVYICLGYGTSENLNEALENINLGFVLQSAILSELLLHKILYFIKKNSDMIKEFNSTVV